MFTLGHRPGLDGLRGIAVIVVVAYHFRVPGFTAGWTGVDLFFALSGFLITSLLLEERRSTGRVDLKAFYVRRALRLFPALWALLAVAVPVSLLLPTAEARSTQVAAAAAFFYVANFAALMPAPKVGLLWHLWTLSMEEQFYAVWPWAFRRAPWWFPASACVVGYVAALAIRPHFGWAVRTFGPLPRGGILLLGSAAAIVLHRTVRSPRWATPTVTTALAVVAAGSAVILTARHDWRVAAFALDVSTVGLVTAAVFAPPRWLTVRPLLAAGKVSYGLYLWHEPINKAWDIYIDVHAVIAVPAKVLLSLAFTWASWRLVETPFLRMKRRTVAVRAPTYP